MEQQKRLGEEVRKTNCAIKRYIDRNLPSASVAGITPAEGLVIGFIVRKGENGVKATDVMDEFHFRKAFASELLTSMSNKGFIRTEHPRGDKRKKLIFITDKGKEAHEIVHHDIDILIGGIESGISEEEKRTFIKVCETIRANVGDSHDGKDH
jgi:DNA-binding MarR family transcriptional regulator